MRLILLIGILTIYQERDNPLYCDRWDNTLHYPAVEPWIALPHQEYERVNCGDLLWVIGEDFAFPARAYDAGRLYENTTALGGPIVGDVPLELAPFDGLAQGMIVVIPGAEPNSRCWETKHFLDCGLPLPIDDLLLLREIGLTL